MNKFEAGRRFVQRMKDNYPPGTRIMLISMGDDPRPVEDNTRGTVSVVDDIGNKTYRVKHYLPKRKHIGDN